MSAIGHTGTFQNQPRALRVHESIDEYGFESDIHNSGTWADPGNQPQYSTAKKTAELYCGKCHHLIDDLPRILPSTTKPVFYETVDPNYEYPIAAVNTPLKFAQEMLKRLGDNNLLSPLLQYYLDYSASVTATLIKSTAVQAWNTEQYDMTPHRPSSGRLPLVSNRLTSDWNRDVDETDIDAPRVEHCEWNKEFYNIDARESETDDLRIKIFPCGHVYHHHCVKDMSDCSHASTCKKAAELFYHRVLVLNFNPDLLSGSQTELLDGLAFSKPSFGARCIGNLRARLWGTGSITNLSDWVRFRGRRALVLVAAAATVAVPVVMTMLSKSAATHGGADEGSPEDTTVAAEILNATVSSVAHTTINTLGLTSVTVANIANATMTALGLPNVTATIARIVNATTAALGIMNETSTSSTVAVSSTTTTAINIANFKWFQTSAPFGPWFGVAASSSGQNIVAVQDGGSIYISSNYGANWSQAFAPSGNWYDVASSFSGQYLAAVQYNSNLIYISSNYGASWSQVSVPSGPWFSVATSSSGQNLVAVQEGGGIYISSNYGANWSQTSASSVSWAGVAVSSSGQYLAALQQGDGIYVSSNYGTNWSQASAPSGNWYDVASSSSGQYLTAVQQGAGGRIYLSFDYGLSWSQASAPSGNWVWVAASFSGQYLVASQYGGSIYVSSDYGTSWDQASAPSSNWRSVAISSSGAQIVATQVGGGIWIAS